MEKYYKKRKVQKADYEKDYWGIITDPDGKVRDRRLERDKFIKNVKSELDFVNSLSPSKILDIGCGLGFMLSGISDKHEKFGLEISKFASVEAKKYANIIN